MNKNYTVVFTQKGCVELQDGSIPQPGENQVLIKTEITQISTGTELTHLEANIDNDSRWNRLIKFPFLPGYTNIGRIVQIGEGVDESYLGKRVLTSSPHTKYAVQGLNQPIIFIPDEIESEEAIFATLCTICMASIRVSDIRPGDTVTVFGAGLIGQLTARLAKSVGALNIFVTDVSDYRLSFLPDDPCFIPVNTAKDNILDALAQYGKKEKARIVFETTAVPTLIENELQCLKKLGRLIITSSPKGKSQVDFQYCSEMGLTIIGAHNGAQHPSVATPFNPWTIKADKEYIVDLLSKKSVSFKNMNTHTAHYLKAPEMYQMLMKDRTQALSVILDWRD